ncbi:MAG: hypothetical protein M3M99_00485 [Actinomycetota bacterium]|nr:hypothetical protein [Actinomycetota bacterium]
MNATRPRRGSALFAAALLLALAAVVVAQLSGGGASAAGSPIATKSAKLKLINDSSLQLSSPNESPRAVALCPGGLEPYGGGMSATPSPDSAGEGVYPHSYERLGAQSGFHTTPVLYDPTPSQTRSYQVTLQVLCTKKFGKVADPHAIQLDVPSGTSVTLVAKCPKKSVLIGGGFQRAAFESAGGVYPTESHAISKTKWQASGTAFGTIRNDMVSIAYCMASPKRKPLLTEVSASVAIAPGQVGFVTTPPCTGGRKMLYNGFDTNPKTGTQQGMFFADGIFNADQTFTASAYNNSGATATLTAYGYCMKNSVIGGSLKKFTKKVGRLDENTVVKEDEG